MRSGEAWPDLLAVGMSAACLVHCLLLPILLALVPALSALLDVPESFHVAAVLVAVPISGWAMIRGFHRHGIIQPALIGAFGLMALAFGALGGFRWLIETGLTVFGSLLLGAAHLQNWRHRRARQGS